ncbi:MAG: GntR family transcriptional regulator, partial [Hyphomicrobiales bacterium]|nr:GntR family transcriptional regulator [Hyphomicrobiales bacterium]
MSKKRVTLKRQTMAGQVAEELRNRIMSGEYNTGLQLMQEQLASEFGVSKVPIREALHLLEAEGLVSQEFHRGAIVSGMSPRQVMEIFELRAEIEFWLIGIALPQMTSEVIQSARAHNDLFLKTEDPIEAWDCNWRFHETLYIPADKPFALEHLRQLHSRTARYVRRQYSIATNAKAIFDEHNRIADMCAEKNKRVKRA